jgi:hypothetical protein
MRSSLLRLATTVLAGLLVVACASATSPVPITTPPSATPDDDAPPRWTATGNMVTPRDSHTATLLLDGTVLVTSAAYTEASASAELYHPGSGT